MIRVGFILSNTDSDWVGGRNYINNLLHAIACLPDRQIEPVLIVSPNTTAEALSTFPHCPVLRTALVDDKKVGWKLARKVGRKLGRDVLMRRFLRNNRIDLISHSGQLGALADFPTIGWLPDFQHVRMPEFFSPDEIAARDRGFRRLANECSTLLLSSVDAQQDLARFAPDALAKSRVLHFVSGFAGGINAATPDDTTLRERYGVRGPYVHLPNQFWAHKNHRVVIDALSVLKAKGNPATEIGRAHV